MKRIYASLQGNQHVNIPGDRMKLDAENNMIYAHNGEELVGAFEIATLLKIYISEKKEGLPQ